MKQLLPKKVRSIFRCILTAGALIGFAGVLTKTDFLSVLGIIVMICSVIFHFLFYKCPYCGKFLDRSTGDFCPYCGRKMEK